MAGARKKWQITYRGSDEVDAFRSEKKTYQFVQDLTRSYATNPDGMSRHLTIWVDEGHGRGWERFDEQDLAELVAVQQSVAASRED